MASPAEQRFKIRFETSANTQGAKAAADAMRQTAAATEDAAKATERAAAATRTATAATAANTAAANANAKATREATTEATKFAQASQTAAGAAKAGNTASSQPAAAGQPAAAPGGGGRSAQAGGRPGRRARAGGGAQAPGEGGGIGSGVLELSRAVEDAQYGVAGVLNNIPTLVAGLGGGAGLAGVLSLVAVAASQAFKHLHLLGDSVDAEKVKAKLEVIKDAANSAYRSLGDGLRDRMVAAIEDAAEAARESLAAAGEAIAKSREEAGRAAEDAAAKQTAYDVAADFEAGMVGANSEDGSAAIIEEQKRRERHRAAVERFDAETARAKADAAAAKGGIRTANEQIAKQQATIDGTGAAKEKVLAGLREQGVISDQEKALQDLDAVQGARDSVSYLLDSATSELTKIDSQKEWTGQDLYRKRELEEQIKELRPRLTAADEELAGRKAIAAAAEQDIAKGQYTFKKTDPAQLRPWQAEALGKAPGQLAAIDKAKADAEGLKKEAEESRKQNAAALEEADRRQKALRLQRDIEVVSQTQQDIKAGALPLTAPEDVAQSAGRLRAESGRNTMTDVYGALPPPLPDPPPPPPPNPPLDVTPQTSTVGQAMEQQASAVSSAMTAMADRTTQIAAGVVQAKQTIEARMAALEQQVQALRTLPT